MKKVIYVRGMSCFQCARGVNKQLLRVPGCSDVESSLEKMCFYVTHDGSADDKALKKAVEQFGFTVSKIENIA